MTETSDHEPPSSNSAAVNEAPDKFVDSEQQSSQLQQAHASNKNSDTEKKQERITFNKESLLQNDVQEEADSSADDGDENLPEFAKQIPDTNLLLEEEVVEGEDIDGEGDTKVGDNFPLMYAQQHDNDSSDMHRNNAQH